MGKSIPEYAYNEEEFAEIMGRIHAAFNVKTQVDLAKQLETPQSCISEAKRRRSVPKSWLLKIWEKTFYSPHYILEGEACGHIFAMPADERHEFVNAHELREEITAKIKHQLDNLGFEDLVCRMRDIFPDVEVLLRNQQE